jgi:cyclic pyranopterin phosphate synthase
MGKFSHMDKKGAVKMVDVTDKNTSIRTARGEGKIGLLPDTIAAITDDTLPKGNVSSVMAAIVSGKRPIFPSPLAVLIDVFLSVTSTIFTAPFLSI